MGDRVLFQVTDGEEFSPIVYGHNSGSEAPVIVRRLVNRMKTRGRDMSYTAARLVQEICEGDPGNLSVGMWNAEAKLTAEDSHGDGGCVILDADGKPLNAFGGYLAVENGKLVIEGS